MDLFGLDTPKPAMPIVQAQDPTDFFFGGGASSSAAAPAAAAPSGGDSVDFTMGWSSPGAGAAQWDNSDQTAREAEGASVAAKQDTQPDSLVYNPMEGLEGFDAPTIAPADDMFGMTNSSTDAQVNLAVTTARKTAEEKKWRDAAKMNAQSSLEAKLDAWEANAANINQLLQTIHTVAWEGSGWQIPDTTEMMQPSGVKTYYKKVLRHFHPDRVKSKDIEHVVIAERVFHVISKNYKKKGGGHASGGAPQQQRAFGNNAMGMGQMGQMGQMNQARGNLGRGNMGGMSGMGGMGMSAGMGNRNNTMNSRGSLNMGMGMGATSGGSHQSLSRGFGTRSPQSSKNNSLSNLRW
jgi:hypothetical protein